MSDFKRTVFAALALAAGIATSAFAQDARLDLKFAGAFEFLDTGTLFVSDNHNGAIYAFDMTDGTAPS